MGRLMQTVNARGHTATYAYDDAGQATSIVHRKGAGGPVIARADYQYDAAGNRTSMTDQDGQHAFDYDDLHRLTEAVHPSTNTLVQAETFSYDAVGNRLADALIGGYTYDSADRLTQSSSFTYTYDADGNMTSRTDRATNLTTTFDYDSENRLTGAQLPGGPSWTYKYDALGRRVQKSSGTAPSQITRYSYDGQDIIATKAGDDGLKAVYTHGGGIDEPLAQVGEDVHFMHADALGSVVAHTSLTGDLQERVSYTAYGQARFSNLSGSTSAVSTTGSPFAFTARELDDETGLYFHRNRQTYEPGAGRFFQADPIGIAGGVNVYAYVEGRPTKLSDPYGLFMFEGGISGIGDFIHNYIELRAANREQNLSGTDKYYHCKANCESSSRGAGGFAVACAASVTREVLDMRIKSSPVDDSAKDMLANIYGAASGRGASAPSRCRQICEPFRPKTLDPKY